MSHLPSLMDADDLSGWPVSTAPKAASEPQERRCLYALCERLFVPVTPEHVYCDAGCAIEDGRRKRGGR